MHRLIPPAVSPLVLAALLAGGCATSRSPTTATKLEPRIKQQVEKGIIEPGFTPEMVYLALGKPSEPAESLVDATTNGTWIYHDFHPKNERGLVRAGFRQRVVADPARKADVVVTERVDPRAIPDARAHSLRVLFRDGRVVEIQRLAEI